MIIYGVALLAGCFMVGNLIGDTKDAAFGLIPGDDVEWIPLPPR